MATSKTETTHIRSISGTVRVVRDRSRKDFCWVNIIPDDDNERCRRVLLYTNAVKDNAHYEFIGSVSEFKGYPQLSAILFHETLPRKTYQLNVLLRSIGLKKLDRFMDSNGPRAVEILENDPEQLRKYLSEEDYKDAIKRLAPYTRKTDLSFLKTLGDAGIPKTVIRKMIEVYGNSLEKTLRENPYRLMSYFKGYGFTRADNLAKSFGVAPDATERIIAGLETILEEAAMSDGHCYLPLKLLVNSAAESLLEGVDKDRIKSVLVKHFEEKGLKGDLVVEDDRVYTSSLYRNENYVAKSIYSLVSGSHPESVPVVSHRDIEKVNGIQYAPEQATAINMAQKNDFLIITGGPGTGKTTTLKGVVQALIAQGNESLDVLAPTGLAANKAKESISGLPGLSFSTIHRGLGYNGHSFEYNEKNPLSADVIIVDETSMMDVNLTAALLRARKPGGKVIFVGDVDQLPSVGPGLVLRDLIESDELPVVRLSRVYRQGKDSPIVTAAGDINEGSKPQFLRNEIRDKEFCFLECKEKDIQNEIVRLVISEIPEKTGIQPSDIQVMSPFKKGTKNNPHDPLSTFELNKSLQAVLNPTGESVVNNGVTFRVGDRVMNLVNNYDIGKDGIINGQQGVVVGIVSQHPAAISVQFKGLNDSVILSGENLDNIDLAYAITVHKSQGSEYPAVIMPLAKSHQWFNTRSLFYTWLTRGKSLAVCVGSEKVMEAAVENNTTGMRYTTLKGRLLNLFRGEQIEDDKAAEIKEKSYGGEKTEGFVLKKPSPEDAKTRLQEQCRDALTIGKTFCFRRKSVVCQNIQGGVYMGLSQIQLLSDLRRTEHQIPVYFTESQLEDYGLSAKDGVKPVEVFMRVKPKNKSLPEKILRVFYYNIEDTNIETVFPGMLSYAEKECDRTSVNNAEIAEILDGQKVFGSEEKQGAYDVMREVFQRGRYDSMDALEGRTVTWKMLQELENGLMAAFFVKGKEVEYESVNLSEKLKEAMKEKKEAAAVTQQEEPQEVQDSGKTPNND